jgi:hypothetical protein
MKRKQIQKVTAGRISFLHVLTGQTGMTGKKDINGILTSRQFCFKIKGKSGRMNCIARQYPMYRDIKTTEFTGSLLSNPASQEVMRINLPR